MNERRESPFERAFRIDQEGQLRDARERHCKSIGALWTAWRGIGDLRRELAAERVRRERAEAEVVRLAKRSAAAFEGVDADQRAREKSEAGLAALQDQLERLRSECCVCEACGHIQGEPNWCHKCGSRTSMPEWAKPLVDAFHERSDLQDELERQRLDAQEVFIRGIAEGGTSGAAAAAAFRDHAQQLRRGDAAEKRCTELEEGRAHVQALVGLMGRIDSKAWDFGRFHEVAAAEDWLAAMSTDQEAAG